MYGGPQWENLKKKLRLVKLDIDGSIIFKWRMEVYVLG